MSPRSWFERRLEYCIASGWSIVFPPAGISCLLWLEHCTGQGLYWLWLLYRIGSGRSIAFAASGVVYGLRPEYCIGSFWSIALAPQEHCIGQVLNWLRLESSVGSGWIIQALVGVW